MPGWRGFQAVEVEAIIGGHGGHWNIGLEQGRRGICGGRQPESYSINIFII